MAQDFHASIIIGLSFASRVRGLPRARGGGGMQYQSGDDKYVEDRRGQGMWAAVCLSASAA